MSKRKILAIVLVLAMVLALPAVAMADNPQKPVATQTTTKPSTIQSVTIGGVTAGYYVDGYGSKTNPTYDTTQLFIRATMPATNTEESLKSKTVVFTLSSGKTITGGSLLTSYPGYSYVSNNNEYTFYNVNLLNTSYSVVIDGATYIIAAGLNDSNQAHVSLPSSDFLAVSDFVYGSGNNAVVAEVYRITVQNPCMGNPFFVGNNNQSENGWTFCSYFIKGINVTASNMSSVDVAFTKYEEASIAGNITVISIDDDTDVTATANLSISSPVLTVTNGSNSRSYEMVALVPSAGMMYVTYGFDFTELRASSTYYNSTIKDEADQIATDAAAYFNGTFDNPSGQIEVPVGCTAMYVIQEFMNAKGYSEYNPNSTYISSINGLGEFDTTGMDGWMYTDSTAGWSTSCHLPNVGAADYYLSAGDHITWFYTLDFTQYWNW